MSTTSRRLAPVWSALPVVLMLGTPPVKAADAADRQRGDHPAVVVQRLHKAAGYDYASKFYPHPAWLYLHAEQPRDLADAAQAPGDPRAAAGGSPTHKAALKK